MKLLAIDIGSSSIKAAILTGPRAPKRILRESFPTRYDGTRAEVDPRAIEKALSRVIHQLGNAARGVDLIAPTVMAPSWVAMDQRGKALTPIVTHQDRRAVEEARQIEDAIGRERHLRLAGNRPFPGGISSTTWRWFSRHEKPLIKRAALVGHLSTWLLRQWCDARVVDPSNAAFMGVYQTADLGGWSDPLRDNVGLPRALLPEIRQADEIAGAVTRRAAERFGLREGTPMLAGCMDGSAAMLAAGDRVGQLLNVSGSTDVLALLVDRARPHEKLLTRPLGVGKRWLAVSTLAAAGSAIEWARQQLFRDLDDKSFYALLKRVSGEATPVQFDADLAGSRTEIDEREGVISRLRLGSTREQILSALCKSLGDASGARLALLKRQYRRIHATVVVSGGGQDGLSRVLRRDWSEEGKWRYKSMEHATLTGLWKLV